MVAAIVGVGSAVAGLASSAVNSSAASKASKNQTNAINNETALGQEGLDWNKANYNEWNSEFQPVLGDIKAAAYANMQPDYAKVGSDVNSAFDAQEQSADRNMNRMGIKPTDGASTASATAYGLGRAAALVSGDQTERHTVANQKLSNLEGVYNLGTPMLTGSMSGVNQSTGQAIGAQGQAAGMYGNQATTYGQAAGAGISSAINSGVNFANNYGGSPSFAMPTVAPSTWGIPTTPTVPNLGSSYQPPSVSI